MGLLWFFLVLNALNWSEPSFGAPNHCGKNTAMLLEPG